MKLEIDTTELKTLSEAASAFNIHIVTLYRWLKEERIAAIIIGGKQFIPQSEIDRIKKADTPITKAMLDGEV